MLADTNDRPGLDERYETATNASRIQLEEHRTGAADVLVAAGWSPTRIGMALLRLHSEWSSADVRGRREGRNINHTDMLLLANGLKSRAAVWAQLSPWLALKAIDPEIGARALLHWLHPVCLHCNGLGMLKVANQPALSGRQCRRCNGTGHRPHPAGAARVLVHLDYCVSVARGSLKQRLRG